MYNLSRRSRLAGCGSEEEARVERGSMDRERGGSKFSSCPVKQGNPPSCENSDANGKENLVSSGFDLTWTWRLKADDKVWWSVRILSSTYYDEN